jgi:hypothetical protein
MKLLLAAFVGLNVLLGGAGFAAPETIRSAIAGTPSFYQMIQTLIDASKLDREAVERAVGMPLVSVSVPPGSQPYSKLYEARGQRVTFDDATISAVDYYEYDKGSGPRVSITVDAGCITETDLRTQYGNLRSQLRDPKADVEFVKEGVWGTLTFGFLRQDCLSYVTVNRKGTSSH